MKPGAQGHSRRPRGDRGANDFEFCSPRKKRFFASNPRFGSAIARRETLLRARVADAVRSHTLIADHHDYGLHVHEAGEAVIYEDAA